jgi:hypothetical protein
MSKGLLVSPPNTRRYAMAPGVVKRLEREIQDDDTPLISKFVTWRNLLNFVDEGEDLLLDGTVLGVEHEALKKNHHAILESSIVLGEHLISLPGISKALKELNCTVNDFKAKLEMLRHKDRIWHGDLTSEKSEQLLSMIFRAA